MNFVSTGDSSWTRRAISPSLWVAASILFIACLLGAAIPDYVSVMGESVGKLVALPAVIVVLFLLAWSRLFLLLGIVLIRASTETLFESTRITFAGSAIGLGGLLNIMALVILALLAFEKPRAFPTLLAKAWLPFFAIVTFGLVIAPDRGAALRTFLQVGSTAAVAGGIAYNIRSRESFKNALKLVVWSSTIPLLVSIWQVATGNMTFYESEGLRLRATFSHPNLFAFYLTLVISIVFSMLKGRLFALVQWKKIVLVIYLFALVVLLLLTKTRSAWGACAMMFVAYAVFFERRYFVYLVLAAVAALFIPGVGDRLLDLTQGSRDAISSTDRLNSFAWRQTLWLEAFGWISPSHYLTGYGLQSFPYYAFNFAKEGSTTNLGAHNVYVQLFFDLGLAGVTAFLWLYGRVLFAVTKLWKIDRVTTFGMAFVIIEFMVVAASDNMLEYLSYNWYLWFIIGAGVAAARLDTVDAADPFPVTERNFHAMDA